MQAKTTPRHFVRLKKIKEFKTPGWQASGERVQTDTTAEEDDKTMSFKIIKALTL